VLNPDQGNGLRFRRYPDVDCAKKREKNVGDSENKKTFFEPRAQFDNNEYYAHRYEERAG
jgi:hypothetical protein